MSDAVFNQFKQEEAAEQVSSERRVKVGVIGCGGISDYQDVVEFMIAGASAVEIGTACLVHPALPVKITEDLDKYCEENGLLLKDLTGTLQRW